MPDRRIMVPARMTGEVIASYRVLKGTIRTYRPELLHALAGEFRARPPSLHETEPEGGFGVIVDTVESQLDDAYDSFIELDRHHRANEARLEVARLVRDEAKDEVSTAVIPARNIAEDLFGPSASHLLGFAGQTPDGLDLFQEQATTLANLLRNPAGEVEPKLVGYSPDRATLAEEIGKASKTLERTANEAELQRRATEASMLGRRDALGRYDRIADGTADILKALFNMAGLPEHAQRVERTVPRRQSQPSNAGEVPVEGPAEGEAPDAEPLSETASTVEPSAEVSPTRVVSPGPWPGAVPDAAEEAKPAGDPPPVFPAN